MRQPFSSNSGPGKHNPSYPEGIKKYYEVPESNFPPIPALLNPQETMPAPTTAYDAYEHRRVKDNIDEY